MMPDAGFEFADRYTALGIPYPDPLTVCQGKCEGTGFVPVKADHGEELYLSLWSEQHRASCSLLGRMRRFFSLVFGGVSTGHQRGGMWRAIKWAVEPCDGWHFVRCPNCHGTGKREVRQ